MSSDASILICCDVDPDRDQFFKSGIILSDRFQWEGALQGIPKLLNEIAIFEKKYGLKVNFNWFFRADIQIETIYGNPAWPYFSWSELIETLKERGDEIGWHPHFWRLHDDNVSWFQETKDVDYLRNCIRIGYDAIPKSYRPFVVRTGWDFHIPLTLQYLSELGIIADLSALPGIKNEGRLDQKTKKRLVVRDWTETPERPYFPSKADHRKEAKMTDDRLTILEIPTSTYLLPSMLRLVKTTRDKIRGIHKGQTFSEPYITKTPSLFRAAINYHLKNRNAMKVPFVVLFHADELLPDQGSYSTKNAIRNISTIVEAYKKVDLLPQFERASQSATRIKKFMGEAYE